MKSLLVLSSASILFITVWLFVFLELAVGIDQEKTDKVAANYSHIERNQLERDFEEGNKDHFLAEEQSNEEDLADDVETGQEEKSLPTGDGISIDKLLEELGIER
ncbi:hypothetical protein [Salsuginibacillus kocurii]|uniref:hypothetical protein n=1 Tax=Salsuginibacillus kocurii TaxID=427078 RepID=UPI0003711FC1|nr:hypothetical protein [Salsuginibacillus kocurii]